MFPLEGESNCSAPEICLARKLGAEITIRYGVIVPTDGNQPIFTPFIKECLDNRGKYPKNTLDNLFWKELSNSTYGKTAQGLREKRVYDLRDKTTKVLPESRITNPFFASFITSFVRAVLGEVINALPPSVCVFSATTDGFLTNATKDQIDAACQGELLTIYNDARKRLTGKSGALEAKHHVRKPLGWRTRGQATLKEGVVGKDDENVVLAKGGIFTPSAYDTTREQNRYITNLFFGRTPESVITSAIKTGVRDMVEYDADLVEKDLIKRLNMEYDWKRCPLAVGASADYDHLVFSTKPWKTVDEFQRIRLLWEEYTKATPTCLKSVDDFKMFANYVMVKTALCVELSKYLKKTNPDIKRLRQTICSAWCHSNAGLIYHYDDVSNAEFATTLELSGVPCSRANFENGMKKSFEPHSVPPTEAVLAALQQIRGKFTNLDIDLILAKGKDGIDLLGALQGSCPFIKRVS
ncbi:conserved hypothetical protein [Magnetospirillum sp. LM-5]|nr:conserved hypothetical protein [Magnetospirillum sp. LM-5]